MGNVSPPSSFQPTSTDPAALNTQSTSPPSPSLPDKPSIASSDDHSVPPATNFKKKKGRKPTMENLSELINENRLIHEVIKPRCIKVGGDLNSVVC